MDRICCFMEITRDDVPIGHFIVQLFNDIVPKTCENFRAFCTGENDDALRYKGCLFHRIIPDYILVTGDVLNHTGTGVCSIYGGEFEDESFERKHDSPFLLSMANSGPNTNGSQFFITMVPAPHLDDKHVVFGSVIDGIEIFHKMQRDEDQYGVPSCSYRISDCGQL